MRRKWPGVLRRPARLPDLFSGYHAPKALVAAVLARAGVRADALAAETAALRPGGGPPGKEAIVGLPAAAAAAAAAASAHASSSSSSSAPPASVRAWREADLHRLVAHFLAARFPILLALNKADVAAARSEHAPAVLAAYPHDAAVAVSAAAERALCALRRAGRVRYAPGARGAELVAFDGGSGGGGDDAVAAAAAERQLRSIEEGVLRPLGGTGAALALSCAVALRPPKLAFPVAGKREGACRFSCLEQKSSTCRSKRLTSLHLLTVTHNITPMNNTRRPDRETLAALAAGPRAARAAAGAAAPGDASAAPATRAAAAAAHASASVTTGVLRDCLLMREGSLVSDVYEALRRPPYCLLEGDLVRAECRALQPPTQQQGQQGQGQQGQGQQPGQQVQLHHQWRPARKGEPLGPANCVLLLLTNRRTAWQAAARQQRGGGEQQQQQQQQAQQQQAQQQQAP